MVLKTASFSYIFIIWLYYLYSEIIIVIHHDFEFSFFIPMKKCGLRISMETTL